jgi:DsbC/DsbD-like thiol-disulfide interchange protein
MRTVFALLLSLISLAALAQDTPPKVSLKLDKASGAAGGTVKGTVTVTFESGLHGYQNPQDDKSLIPIEVIGGDKATKIVNVVYPKGVSMKMPGIPTPVKVYEGTISIPVTFKLPDTLGATTLKIKLKFQQCNESNCFPPSSTDASAKVTVQKKTMKPPKKGR